MCAYYRWLKIAGLALALVAALALTGCGGGGPVPGPTPTPTPTPAPTITSVSPSTVTAGGPAFTLTVNGANYLSSSVVQFNGSPRATTVVSSTQLQGAITSADIASGAQETVTVANPQGQGGVSSGFTFTANNPVPSISNLNPSALAAGASAFTLTVTGSNFVPTSVLQFNGAARPTTFVSSTTLQAAIPAADIAKVGLLTVTVFNPAPAGGTSGNLTFTAAFPPPKITLLQPSSAVSGGAGFTMTVSGTNFVPSSVVKFNGNTKTTTFISSTQLQATITAADIASIGLGNVTVVNVVTNKASLIAGNAGVDPTTSDPSTFFTGTTGGPGFAQVILNQTSRDLAYDPSQQVIYVSVPGTASTHPNTISVLSLANVQFTSSPAVVQNPGILAMSGDVQFLYAGIDGAASVQRFTLPGPTKDISISLGSDPIFGPFVPQDLQVAPGLPHTLAVAEATFANGGVAIFDDAAQRPTKVSTGINGFTSLQWGSDATKIFRSDSFAGLEVLSVNGSGATLTQTFSGVVNGDRIHFGATTGLLYGEGGEAVQPANGLISGNFNVRGPLAVDPTLNAVFIAPQFFFGTGGNLEAFDLTRFTLNRSITVTGVTGTPQRMIRWGQNGLAFNTNNGQIVIVAGNFLDPISSPAATPIPTPAPTPTPNPNPQAPTITFLNPGSAVAGGAAFTLTVNGTNFTTSSVVQFNGSARTTTFITAMQLQAAINAADIATAGVSTITVQDPTNGPSAGSSFLTGTSGGTGFAVSAVNEPSQDIVLDPARQAIYLSVPNTVPEGNSIAVLDLASGKIIGTQFAGSNPDVLAISDDSQFLYTGLDGSASVQRFSLPALATDISYPLGGNSFFGPYFALDLQVAPGTPHTTAVSLANRGVSPQAIGGITIFDDATPRPTIAKGFGPGGGGGVLYDSIQWGPDTTSMVAANGDDTGFDFYTLSVNASGITLNKDIQSAFDRFGNHIHFDRGTNLVYSEDGRALDPSSGLPAGLFQTSGLMVPDSGLNTAFFLNQGFGSTSATITSFDMTHFTNVGSITVPNISGQALHLIRWGQNGLAFNTNNGQVVLVGGSFLAPVPTTFPAPAPLPTPAPTPAPGAPVISLLTPSSAVAGGATFTITVTGTNFDPTAVVQFNGTALTTTFNSSTQLQATVPAADIASPGAAIITVANPVSNGGTSAGSTFFTGSSGGSNFAVSAISQPANDLTFDSLHGVILLSVPSTAAAHGNTISALDPRSVSIISSQFAGSEPGVLALSDDDQFLYAGINGGAKVQRFTLPALGIDMSYSLGSGGFISGPNVADDLQVAPGSPHTTAVATEQGTITVFDDATPRTATGAGGTSIQWGNSASTLFSTGGFFGDLLTFSAAAGGLTKTTDVELAIGNRIHFDRGGNHLLWAENGHVVDPTAGSPVAVLSASGPTVPDSGLNAAFVLTQLGPGVTLHAVDMTHFIEVGSITIPNVNGSAKRLIRWGQNGLAFNTDQGQIFLVAGNFVSPIVTATGPANPLPPPPPTPANNAPVISRLSPSFAVAGGAQFTLTVTGTSFDPAAAVQFNGVSLATTFISSTQLTATVPVADIAHPGTTIVTVLNPVSNGGASAGSTFFVGANGGTGFAVTELNQPANDLVFDPLRQVILLSVPASAGANGNSISAIDLSGNIISTQFAGSQPNVLALSGDSTTLYSGIDGASKVQRFTLPSLAPDISYSVGGGGFLGLSTAQDVQVAPGAPQTSAVVINQANPSGETIVFDNATPRAATVNNGNSLQWGTSASTLYSSTGFTSDLLAFTVSPGGLTLNHDFQSFLSGKRIHFDPVTSLVYSDGGAVIDPATGLAAATFKASGLMVVDSGLNTAFFLQLPITGNTANIESFDLTHFVSLGTISIPGVTGNPGRLIRWGQNGLAFNTADGHLFLIGGDFVGSSSLSIPPTNPLPTPTPFTPGPSTPTISSLNPGSAAAGGSDVALTVNGTNFTASSVVQFNGSALTTTFVSANVVTATIPAAKIATAGTALLTVVDPAGTSNTSTFLVGGTAGTGTGGTTFAFSAISQAANDLIFDPVHQVFLVSVPSNVTGLGNTVDALDLSGNLISTQFAGSEPTMLGLSDDGQFLYAGINGAGKAQRFSLPAFTTDINYSLGPPNFFGPTVALNLGVAPGTPHTVAYATGAATSFFETEGVAVFDDQTQRTNRPFTSTSWIQWGANNATLFGADTFGTDLSVMTVDGNGVTVQQFFSSAFSGANQIRFVQATGFVYGNDGRVVNPSTGALVGSYTLPFASGPKFMVPDSTVGKAFFLTQTLGTPTTITLESFDLTHFTAISSISFNVTGTAQNLVRWGTNGLAFRTNQGQIVLVAGTFVN